MHVSNWHLAIELVNTSIDTVICHFKFDKVNDKHSSTGGFSHGSKETGILEPSATIKHLSIYNQIQ